MDEKVLEQLENVPTSSEDAYNELISIIENTYCKLEDIKNMKDVFSDEEIERLNYELKKIKEWGVARVFVFGVYLCRLGATTLGIENYSYINYLLGVATLNPVSHGLPFERFFNEYRKFLPVFYMFVEKGGKGKTLKRLYEKYGKSLFIKPKDSDDVYYTSGKPLDNELIKESVIVAKENEEAYEENISILTSRELSKLGFYSFSITEVESIEYLETEVTEQTILEKKKELFEDCYRFDIEEFNLIEELKPYISYTENKLIYQEQLLEKPMCHLFQ